MNNPIYIEANEHRTFHSADGNATEVEVHAFVRGLLALLQPRLIVETGTYHGAMTNTLLTGSSAIVHTCETDPALLANLAGFDNHIRLRIHPVSGVLLIRSRPEHSIDFAFLDSSGDRLEELKALIYGAKLASSAAILIHDSFREIECVRFLRNHTGRDVIELPTARGLAISL